MKNKIYKATVINNPTGKNNPILKFKLEDGTYIEKEYKYGASDWGKGQTFNIKYNKKNIEVLEKSKFYLLPFFLYPIIIVILVLHYILNNIILDFLFLLILSIFPIILSCLIYFIMYKKDKIKSSKEINGKVIAFIPIFKSHISRNDARNGNFYELEWRMLFEFKAYNGEIFRCIENDRIFGGDRNVLTNKFTLNNDIPIRYNIENQLIAFIDTNNYEIEFKNFKGKVCKAKIVKIETFDIESLEKNKVELIECFKQEYLICEYDIEGNTYVEKSQFPVNCGMFSVGEEIEIRYNVNNYKEYNVSYFVWK